MLYTCPNFEWACSILDLLSNLRALVGWGPRASCPPPLHLSQQPCLYISIIGYVNNWAGVNIHVLCSELLKFLLKLIVFRVCEQKCVNTCALFQFSMLAMSLI